MSSLSSKMRIEFAASDAKRDEGLTTPSDIQRFDDIKYGPDSKMNLLDLYRPKDASWLLPVIINVHGGGWVYATKETYQYYCMNLAERGFAVINFSYRLAPESKFPAQLEDINLVAQWVIREKDTYHLDIDNIFFTADSAGGHLAALYASILTNNDYAMRYNFAVPESFSIKAVSFSCGAYIPISGTEADIQDAELMKDLLPGGGSPEEAELINATLHISPNFPPTMLMSCYGDFCQRHIEPMENALKRHGVFCIKRIYGSDSEPLYHVFNINVREKAGMVYNNEQCDFFRKFMTPKGAEA